MSNRSQNILSQISGQPVIIWGTGTAGRICCRLLQNLNVKVVAAGDNNVHKIGQQFYGVPIMSVQQIESLYPDALIVIGSFYQNVSDTIKNQLTLVSGRFSFCRFEQVEYLYEIRCLKRKIEDKVKFFEIINNIGQNEESVWKRKLNKDVMSEYQYVVHDGREDGLKAVLSRVYGVKKLMLIIKSEKINESADLIEELAGYDNVGHIIAVLESNCILYKEILKRLVDKVFYIVCNEMTDKCSLEEIGFAVEIKKLPEELFLHRNQVIQDELTEEAVVHSVLRFVNGKDGICNNITYEKVKPVHIVQLFNGLANQMLMYLFGSFIEEESNRTIIFDNTVLCLDAHDEDENTRRISQWNKSLPIQEVKRIVRETRKRNSFYFFKRAEVAEVFDIPIRLLSDYFDEETWEAYLAKVRKEISCKYAQSFPLGQILLKNGMDIAVVRDNSFPDEFLAVDDCYGVDTYILDMPYQQKSMTDFLLHNGRNTYYLGIWATGRADDWLSGNREWVRKKFSFRLNLDEKNRNYVKEITQADGVMIHVRRGDFSCCNMAADTEYFRRAIQEVEALSDYGNKKYFIFSDDLEWCRQHEKELGIDQVSARRVYVSGNVGEKNYIDMYLMSLGKIIIPTPGSSFSYVAMLISKTMEKSIDVPKYLYYGIPELTDIKK